MKITHSIATAYGAELAAAEISWQTALADAGRNLAALASATRDGRIGITLVNELVSHSLAGMRQLAAAGESYATLHDRVSALARLSGLEPTSYGMSATPKAELVEQAAPARHRRSAGDDVVVPLPERAVA